MANLDIIIRAQNLASAALRQVEGQLSGIQRQATFAERGFGGLQRAVGVGMVAAGTAATAGLVALGAGLVQSVTAAADFESQINILTVAARASGTSMADLSAVALQVGSDASLVGISASEAADAMTNFYKAGLSTNDIFSDLQGYLAGTVPLTGALRAAVDLAAASELDLATASDVVAVAMATFGLEASDAARIADTLVGAADASLASVGGLAEGLRNIGPVAASMGESLEDTTTMLALLSTRGIQGSEAGTALKSMMLNLQRPTKAVTETLDALGVSLYNSDGTMRGMYQIVASLEGAMAGLTEEQRQQAAVTLAGSYGLAAFNVLLSEGESGWDAMAESIANAASAQEVAAARTKGFNAAIEQLKGAMETFLITVGMPLIQEFLTPAAQWLGTVITKLTEMAPSVEDVRRGYDTLIRRGAELLTHINAVLGPIAAAISLFVSWKDALIAIGIVLGTMAVSFALSIAPILAVAAALVGAVALIRNAWENDWGGIQAKTQAVADAINEIIDSIKQNLKFDFDWKAGFVRLAWGDVFDFTLDWKATIAKFTWENVFDFSLDWVAKVKKMTWGDVFDFATSTNIGINLIAIAKNIDWTAAVESVVALRSKITSRLANINWADAVSPIVALGEKAKEKFASIDWTAAVESVVALRSKITSRLANINWADAVSPIVALGEKAKEKFASIDWTAAVEKVGTLHTLIKDKINGANWAGIASSISGLINSGLSQLSSSPLLGKAGLLATFQVSVVNAVFDSLNKIDWKSGATLLTGFINSFLDSLSQVDFPKGGEALAKIVNGFIYAIAAVDIEKGSVGIAGFVNGILSAINSVDFAAAGVTLSGFVNGFAAVLNAVDFEALGVSVGGLANALIGALAALDWSGLGGGLGEIINALVAALGQPSLWANLGSALAGIVNGVATALNSIEWYGKGGISDTTFNGLSLAISTAIKEIDWSAAATALTSSIGRWILDAATFGASEGKFLGGIGQNKPAPTLPDETWPPLPKMVWPPLPKFNWPIFSWPPLPKLNWPIFSWPPLPEFTWPEFTWPAWTWPTLPSWSWPTLPKFTWPALPTFTWPTLPTLHVSVPSWLQGLLNVKPSASGTGFFGGGLTLVGERGPEVVMLPRGSRIESSERTERMMGGGVTVNVYATVSGELDIEEMAYRIAQTIQRRGR